MLDIVTSFHCMQFQGRLMIQTQDNGEKTHFGPRNFCFKNLTRSVTRYHGQLSSCTIPEKTNDPILRKLSDGRTDARIDGRVTSEEAARLTPSVQ